MKNRKDTEAEALQQQLSEIAQRKSAFQTENRRQMRARFVFKT